MKSNDFKDKITIITGGGSGIGEAMGKHFSDKKAKVIILDNNEAEGRDQENKLISLSAILDEGSADDAFNQIERNYGRIDILINNAGIAHIGKLPKRILKILIDNKDQCSRCLSLYQSFDQFYDQK